MLVEFNFQLGDSYIAFLFREREALESSLQDFRAELQEISDLLPRTWRFLSSRSIPVSEAQERTTKVMDVTSSNETNSIFTFKIIKLEIEDFSKACLLRSHRECPQDKHFIA